MRRAPVGPPGERGTTADTPGDDGEETLEMMITELAATMNRSKWTASRYPPEDSRTALRTNGTATAARVPVDATNGWERRM
jgi:hypothetical protein